jgi:hypothetical protein
MTMIRTPGIHFESSIRQSNNIELGETGIPAFLGVAERGPLGPVKIINFNQFKQIYGNPIANSYLHSSIEGFFLNGGKTCFVLRVAHIFRKSIDEELARRAHHEVLDRNGFPSMDFMAASEGSWGNEIQLKIEIPKEARIKTSITVNLASDDESVSILSSRGLEVGMIIRVYDDKNEKFVTINKIRGNEIFWSGGIGYFFKAAAPTYVEPVEFNIFVSMQDVKENFLNLSLSDISPRNFMRTINRDSKLIRVRDLESSSILPNKLPENIENLKLTGGKDGLEYLSPDDFIGSNSGPSARFGLGSLEPNDEIDLIAIPDLFFALNFKDHKGFKKRERDVMVVHRAMIDHCERMGDRFAILDLPESLSVEAVQEWRLQFDTSYAAIYYPWLVIIDRSKRRSVPPCGYIAGLYARCDREEGIHRIAANVAIEGVVDTSKVLREDHIAELNHKSINCIRSFPVRGTRPWGGRTLASDINWRFINVRRTFNAVRRAIYQSTQWVVFEPNNAGLRGRLKSSVEDFLRRLWSAGYFKGTNQEEAFFVVCDDSNNSLENIESGLLSVDIGLAPIRPAEFINLRLEHTVEDRRIGDLDLE